jgi:glycolate oxidase FAD binding subunit
VPAETPPAKVAALVDGLRTALAPHRGSAVVRYAPEAVRDEIDLWGPVPALSLMRRVKDQFDPEHRLSPGRFVGGI